MALAADIHPGDDSGDYKTMQRICKEEGIIFPIKTEDWHGQPEEVPTSYWNGLP
jgi:hypothetical protein